MDFYASITELTVTYERLIEQLNSDPCETDASQVYYQQAYRNICVVLRSTPVEPIALHLIAEGINDRILTRLQDLIRTTIHIFETRREVFGQINFGDLCRLQEDYLFAGKRALLLNDQKQIGEYPYPDEQVREQLLRENRIELDGVDNERNAYHKENADWISTDYYTTIYEMSYSSASIFDSYFPVEKATETTISSGTDSDERLPVVKNILPDEIFRSRMFDKFRELEERLVKLGDLDGELRWQAKHKNDKPDIKRLVTFLTGLLDNGYFLPKRDMAIKCFFEMRYRITIGQNFERRRREPLIKIYRTIFYNLPF